MDQRRQQAQTHTSRASPVFSAPLRSSSGGASRSIFLAQSSHCFARSLPGGECVLASPKLVRTAKRQDFGSSRASLTPPLFSYSNSSIKHWSAPYLLLLIYSTPHERSKIRLQNASCANSFLVSVRLFSLYAVTQYDSIHLAPMH